MGAKAVDELKVQAAQPAPGTAPGVYGGLALVALATLLAELTLTRVFSVVLWYHFAFISVSVALFGMTVGAVVIHLLPGPLKVERRHQLLAGGTALFALTLAVTAWLLVAVPWRPPGSGASIWALGGLYAILAVPFTCSGLVVSLALTGSPAQVNRLYAADLVGAATGCLAMALVIGHLGGPGTLVGAAVLAAAAAVLFSIRCGRPAKVLAAGLVALLAIGLALGQQHRLLEIRFTKGERKAAPLFERWNAFSRVAVWPQGVERVHDWGGSLGRARNVQVDQRMLDIDGGAATPLTRFDGTMRSIGFFQADLSALASHLRPGGHELVIGAGGGRDVLIGLASGQRRVTAVELNPAVLEATNKTFGDFTGHLDRWPGVRFVNDEARSYISRSHERYDVITCSLIDTWAATAAGAFVFSENGLYTIEAWQTFLSHLGDRGILAMTRWYYAPQPSEVLRLVSLARAVLERQFGVKDARNHIMVARTFAPGGDWGAGAVLVSRTAFGAADRQRAEAFCQRWGHDLVVAPGVCRNRRMADLLESPNLREVYAASLLDLTPPTDDRPFFFHMLKRGGAHLASTSASPTKFNLEAVRLLNSLLVYNLLLTVLFVALPLGLGAIGKQYRYERVWPFLGFFTAIGLAYMLTEIGQMQRLMIFLGHPIYGLVVVLFSLLLSSGLGSLASRWLAARIGRTGVMLTLVGLLLVLLVALPALTAAARGWPMNGRLVLAVLVLLPMGFLMGMPFPIGMAAAGRQSGAPLAWYWGVNGACSVLASVAAMAFSLWWGVTVTTGVGLICYGAAAVCLLAACRPVKAT